MQCSRHSKPVWKSRAMANEGSFTIGEWAIILGVPALLVATCRYFGIDRKWEDSIFYTIVVFGVVMLALRKAWGYRTFWNTFAVLLVVHMSVVAIILLSLPPGARPIHGVPLTLAAMGEGALIIRVLWKKSLGSGGNHPEHRV
jgi:hypothetical protein